MNIGNVSVFFSWFYCSLWDELTTLYQRCLFLCACAATLSPSTKPSDDDSDNALRQLSSDPALCVRTLSEPPPPSPPPQRCVTSPEASSPSGGIGQQRSISHYSQAWSQGCELEGGQLWNRKLSRNSIVKLTDVQMQTEVRGIHKSEWMCT